MTHDYGQILYHRHNNLPFSHAKPEFAREAEQLTGSVNDIKANQFEERLANALNDRKVPYYFRYAVGAPKGFPGWKEVDFLVSAPGQVEVIMVDGVDFVHRGSEAQAQDQLNDIIIKKSLVDYGINIVRHISTARLTDQTSANQVVREIFG
jgi:hypothetical protein